MSNKNSDFIVNLTKNSRREKGIFRKLLFISLILASLCGQVFAEDQGMDIVLVLDTSGSMKQNDPNELRVQAAKLFVSLLSRKDNVSLVGFSNRAYPVTPLLSLNSKKNETRLLKAIERMSAKGQYSNLHDAILRGYELLSKNNAKNRTRHIILMSDGKMDLGSQSKNLRLLEQTLDYLTPSLASQGIKLHTIAFNDKSYIPLLKLAAEDTNGEFILLKNTDGIHQVFERIFERTKLPQMLPIDSDSFIVDKSVKELTIIASKFRPESIISIETPDGEELTRRQHPSNVKWYKARKFDLITVKKPAPGYWLVKFSEGGNKAYIVSDLKLQAKTTKTNAEPGAPLHIQAYLEKKNRRIKNKSLLKSTVFRVKVTSPTGATIENKMVDDGSEIGSERKDGIYGISYSFDKEGTYKIEVTAQNETFDRKKTLFVNVKSATFKTPFKVQQEIITQPDMLDAADNKQAENEHLETTAQTQNTPNDPMVDDLQHGGGHGSDQSGDTSQHSEHASTKLNENGHENNSEHSIDDTSLPDNTTHDGDNSDEELKSNSDFGVKDAVIAFIAFNTFLLTLGGGYYLWYRRKQKQKDKDIKDEDDNKEKTEIENDVDSSTEVDESSSNMELESEEGFSTSISDIDLEEELSSILENEK